MQGFDAGRGSWRRRADQAREQAKTLRNPQLRLVMAIVAHGICVPRIAKRLEERQRP
jgi:hypothetical protein